MARRQVSTQGQSGNDGYLANNRGRQSQNAPYTVINLSVAAFFGRTPARNNLASFSAHIPDNTARGSHNPEPLGYGGSLVRVVWTGGGMFLGDIWNGLPDS